MSKLNTKAWALSLGTVTVIFYLVCLGWLSVYPVSAELHDLHVQMLELSFPGFEWLTFGGFLFGLIESFVYGLATGGLIAYFHNFYAKK